MLLIYTEKISPRFNYIVRHIFENMMGVQIEITTELEPFIKSNACKISYAKAPIGNEFFIKSSDFLYEKGISTTDIYVNYWEEIPYFFCSKKGDIPFDVFSASFYLLSRYEEYLPHFQDSNGNFIATESIAYKYNFLELPIVDIWVNKIKELLILRYPELVFSTKKYRQNSVIEVKEAFRYRHKGILRSLFQTMIDVFMFRWSKIIERCKVKFRLRKDPYDFYDKFIELHKEHKNIRTIFFFLLANYTTFDRGISFNNMKYRHLIKYMADYSIVSVLGSYDSVLSTAKLKEERKKMIEIINRPVKRFRASYNRAFVPDVYRRLCDADYNEDYTMGYLNHLGFRAGTCTPFYFYDIGFEVPLPIKINPICFHSEILNKISEEEALTKLKIFKTTIQNVGGEFVMVFSNDFFGKSRSLSEFNFYKEVITI